jgi:hypothetical protein
MVSTAAVMRDKLAEAIDVTVADGTGIEKGTLLKLTDPRTAIISTAAADKCIGIAAREKVASDGRTRLSVFTKGIFDMACSGVVGIGDPLQSGAYNNVMAATTDTSGSAVLGFALEAGTDEELIQVYLDVGGGRV